VPKENLSAPIATVCSYHYQTPTRIFHQLLSENKRYEMEHVRLLKSSEVLKFSEV
jgi:hypothetical protein